MSQELEKVLLNADDVCKMLGVKPTTAYRIIRECNQRLKESGELIVRGRVNKQYLLKVLDVSNVS